MSLRSISIQLNSTALSDLFFNFEHPEYASEMKRLAGPPKRTGNVAQLFVAPEQIEAAVLKDAMEFTSILGFVGDEQESLSAELAADFMHRL